jgi:uncharacterized membrane protein
MSKFTDREQQLISDAIEVAELATSGEIRVCIEKKCPEDVLDRAANYFSKLGMNQTSLRNGVLIYVATEDHKFAIIGDAGINKVVPTDFWNSTKDAMAQLFKQGQLAEGIVKGVELAGQQLKTYFPFKDNDKNELSNDIHYTDH